MDNAKKGWSRGFTKDTHPSVKKISETMRAKHIDNFSKWRKEMRRRGKIKSKYGSFPKTGYLAELIGVVLGDGHIQAFPRTERLIIAANANNTGFVLRYTMIVRKIFKKEPRCMKVKTAQCIRISIYEKHISRRLGVPTGNRKNSTVGVPLWVWRNKKLLIRCLRGLYEAEGSFCVHKPTGTYKMLFSNKNPILLSDVDRGLRMLGFHPNRSGFKIQLSAKKEVYAFRELIRFRKYGTYK
ncbi:hypothetical protein HY839_04325 [Candidatus Azambacteria bacterium]|nr:hypothetical protein [Candidatus Azambacteria bacterium]